MALIIRICLLVIFCACAHADNTIHAIAYDFQIQGLESESIEKQFNARSSLISYKDSPIFSEQNLNKRICDDYELLLELMEAKGYYDCDITIDRNTQENKEAVVFKVNSGVRYKLKTITIDLGQAYDDILAVYPFMFEELPIRVGKKVSAEKIFTTFNIITQRFGNCGYPFAKIRNHSLQLIRDTKRVELVIDVDPGPKVRFGDITINGTKDIPVAYVRNRAPWEKGEVYDERKIERYREKLSRTRLFDSIVIDHPKEAHSADLPINVDLSERQARTLTAGFGYSTNEEFAGNIGWIHRSLTGQADRLRATLTGGQVKSKFELDYELPDFIWPKTSLAPSLAFVHEDTESYVSQSYGAAVLLRTEFAENSEYFYGISLDHDRVKQENQTKKGTLFGLPVGIKYDRRDDLLDPTRGYVANATFTPKVGKIADANFMTKTILSGSYYYPVAPGLVVASWARLGSINGIAFSDVLANQRFYSGGGGSVRAYGYQFLGPLDGSYDPTGGKSLAEGGIEFRFRFLENWGAAAFFEGGTVDHHTIPTFKHDVLGGAGLGVRYFTDFGPIRADIAFPFKRRKKVKGYVDDVMQFYISIGQGF